MKLAIVIEGLQNSGKTSTFHYLLNRDKVRRHYQYWLELSSYAGLGVYVDCVSSSPSEQGTPLSKILGSTLPSILIIAEQKEGAQINNSIDFLVKNHYEIKKFEISDVSGPGNWDRFNKSNEKSKLNARKQEIIQEIKKHLIANIGLIL